MSVVNAPAGEAPTSTLNPTLALAYQLCFKCHSGYTLSRRARQGADCRLNTLPHRYDLTS